MPSWDDLLPSPDPNLYNDEFLIKWCAKKGWYYANLDHDHSYKVARLFVQRCLEIGLPKSLIDSLWTECLFFVKDNPVDDGCFSLIFVQQGDRLLTTVRYSTYPE